MAGEGKIGFDCRHYELFGEMNLMACFLLSEYMFYGGDVLCIGTREKTTKD